MLNSHFFSILLVSEEGRNFVDPTGVFFRTCKFCKINNFLANFLLVFGFLSNLLFSYGFENSLQSIMVKIGGFEDRITQFLCLK